MLEIALVGAILLATASFFYLRTSRAELYRELGRRQPALRAPAEGAFGSVRLPAVVLPDFRQRLAMVPDVLPADLLRTIAKEVDGLASSERTYLPTHKKGGTIAYETLCAEAPSVVALYLSPALQHLVATI